MSHITRLPALPLVTCDPYFSIWSAADKLTNADTTHWAGARKRLRGSLSIDGTSWRFLGLGKGEAMDTAALDVTPTSTRGVFEAAGIRLTITFTTPLLLDDPDRMSTPITLIDVTIMSTDNDVHQTELRFEAYDELCYDGETAPRLVRDRFEYNELTIVSVGQRQQKLLCHAADHITIDWGFLYLAGNVELCATTECLAAKSTNAVKPGESTSISLLLGYDDVASINYFGTPTKAWYARNGLTFVEALLETAQSHDLLLSRCAALDEQIIKEATARGGDDYAVICAAAYRQCIAAHKLIADEQGRMVLLSKENDSNGCIGTVDVSYPSTPLFLKYNPELVRAMCRPVMRFAQMPVWAYDFAPHDVGQYPQVTGQVYGAKVPEAFKIDGLPSDLHPQYYMRSAQSDCYELRKQMPVEECGNMLVMLCAAASMDGNWAMADADKAVLAQWVQYLLKYGEDPGDQLCTDDFAGHLARNVNLSAKALVGVACYALMLAHWGDPDAAKFRAEADRMAQSWLARAQKPGADGTSLTFDGQGWSMKYNLAWDKILHLGLLENSFYETELASYLSRINQYGLPLDSRADYTKSDWILWTAAMTQDPETFARLVAPVAKYLRESSSRVAFSDWYDTVTGKYVYFIARSVQGGVYMPLLAS
ncbi:hypothetical protein AGMMS49992_03500 [Clostridia bacterium]|nr:hypothetical protein AGMMS49992_03500 [Clostridia bacterium]